MPKHGFKELSIRNWLEPDEVMAGFVRISESGASRKLMGADWLDQVLAPTLSDNVPEGVQALFEVARGAFAYGYFFYPLYTLAAEQLYRVAEAAINHKCVSLDAPSSTGRFVQRINWLAEKGVLIESHSNYWHSIRHLRNSASHPKRQQIMTPAMAIGALHKIAESINSLFAGD